MSEPAKPSSVERAGSASLRELLDAVGEFRKHAMYPYPDCSTEKKMAFIKASERLDAAVRLNAPHERPPTKTL